MKKIAINGLGRIGKLVFQYLLESEAYKNGEFEIVAINDLTNVSQLAHLLKYDSTQLSMTQKGHTVSYRTVGEFEIVAINDLTNVSQLAHLLKYDSTQLSMTQKGHTVSYRTVGENEIVAYENLAGWLVVDGKEYPVFAQPDPTKLPWKDLEVDYVCECTGRFATVEAASQHLKAGAKHVIVNSPVKGVPNIVYNVNSDVLTGDEEIICGASCTTNCLAPLAKILDESFGIVKGMMTTVHSFTADQTQLDAPHKKGEDSRRGRCASANIVPTSTGAAEAVAKALPKLKGKLTGVAMRVPTPTGSVVVFDVELHGNLTADAINTEIKNKMDNVSISGTYDPIVSSDIIGCEYGSYVDFQLTRVLDWPDRTTTMAQVVSWYDNEASYTHQFVNTLIHWMNL